LPNTGLIVTIDIGEARDIYPRNKVDVGKRMAYWALTDVYQKRSVKSGPAFRNAMPSGSGAEMLVVFDGAGSGLKTRDGSRPAEFAIAGADKKWYWAQAEIVSRNQVKVWSPSVPKPVAVRYAFNNNPRNPN